MNRMPGSASVRDLLEDSQGGLDEEQDWETLRREGLLALVAGQLLRARRTVPDSVRQTFLQSMAFEMLCSNVLAEISQAAQARGIPTLAFKGCALAFGLYPQAAQRSFGDIDVAVPARHGNGMEEVLKDLGFSQYLCVFSRDGVTIDLHQHPLHQLTQLVGPPSQEWWDHVQPLSERTGAALRLAHEHEFVLGLFHGAKHSFSRASWLVDLALLAQSADPQRLAEAVARFRARRQLAYAAECLDVWFGWCLPEALCRLAPRRWNFVERRFVHLVLERKAPDFLGMLTPLSSAPHPWAALLYLMKALYPAGTPRGQRSKQLWGMARSIWRA
jgi:hypothetical protein